MFSCCASGSQSLSGRRRCPLSVRRWGTRPRRQPAQFRLLADLMRAAQQMHEGLGPSSAGGGVFRSINSETQSSSTDVLLQLLDSSGAATQGMPASRILSMAFSSTFRQATPTMASTWPLTMILRTMGVPSETSTL